jgi:hypothetical protein
MVMGRARICANLNGNFYCEGRSQEVLRSSEGLQDLENIETFVHVAYNRSIDFGTLDSILDLFSPSDQSLCTDDGICRDATKGPKERIHAKSKIYSFYLFMERYMRFLATDWTKLYCIFLSSFPLVTKSITAAFIGGFGDLLAQIVESYSLERKTKYTGKASSAFDGRRTFAIVVEGLCISGPMMHYAYDWLESVLPVHTPDPNDDLYEWLAAMSHVLVDAILMDSFSVGTILVCTCILEGRGTELLSELKQDYIPTVKVSWASSLVFAPLQCTLFRFLHVNYRVLAMNIQDVVWNGMISYMAHRSRQ